MWDHKVKIWDTTPPTAEVPQQRQAFSVARFLSGRRLSRADMLTCIRKDATLSEPVR